MIKFITTDIPSPKLRTYIFTFLSLTLLKIILGLAIQYYLNENTNIYLALTSVTIAEALTLGIFAIFIRGYFTGKILT